MKYWNKKTLLLTSLCATIVSTQAALNPEQILPENTLAVFAVRDINKSCADFKTTAFGHLLQDPAMQPFYDYVEGYLNEFWDGLNKEIVDCDINLSDYQDILAGGGALTLTAVQANNSNATEFRIFAVPLILLETKGDPATVKSKLSDLTQKFNTAISESENSNSSAANTGQSIIGTNTFNNLEFTTVTIGKAQIWLGQLPGNLLAITVSENKDYEDTQYVQKTLTSIAQKKEGYKTLADAPEFKKHTNIQPDDNYFWFDFTQALSVAKEFIKILDAQYVPPKDMTEALMSPPRPMAIYKALGLDALKSFSIVNRVEDGEDISISKLFCPAEERRGLTALLDAFPVKDCGPTEMIPADVISFHKSFIDWQAFLTILDGTSNEAMGGIKTAMLSGVQTLLDRSETPIDLKEGIWSNLTEEVCFISFPCELEIKDSSDDTTQQNKLNNGSAILFGAKDPELFISTVKNALKSLRPETIQITDVICDKMDGYVVLKLGYPSSEKIINFIAANGAAQENSLAKSNMLLDAAEHVGGFEQTGFNYGNVKLGIQSVYDIVNALLPFFKEAPDFPPEVIEGIEKLPDFKTIEKYFEISINTTKVTREGVESTTYTPWPSTLER